jgi:hypothetical protein
VRATKAVNSTNVVRCVGSSQLGVDGLRQVYLPDVGKTPATYQLRYMRRADGAVVEVRVPVTAPSVTPLHCTYTAELSQGTRDGENRTVRST